MLENSTRLKPLLYEPVEGMFLGSIVQASVIETVAVSFVPISPLPSSFYVLLTFIPMSFAFEIAFDFFHYWFHRSLHWSGLPWHKTHHTHVNLSPAIAFYQDWADLLIANVVPFFLAERIIHTVWGPFTAFELALLLTYKICVEISGHAGRRLSPASSFPQCVWLPRTFGIELYAEDHALHHTKPGCNFAKRFTLWDKVFGTYQSNAYASTVPEVSIRAQLPAEVSLEPAPSHTE
jgi:sterol desaturase/sphingolipid hydroxylase (fatty acid hydroxylase superfamily)